MAEPEPSTPAPFLHEDPIFTGPGNPAAVGALTGGMPDGDLPGRAPALNPLEAIAAELTAEVDESITLAIDQRPGWSAIYSLNVNHESLGIWRKAASDRSQPDGINELRFACIVIGNLNTGIIRNGALLELAGEVLTWRSAEIRQMLGVGRVVDCVRKAYGRDAHIVAASRAVLEKAGYGVDAHEDLAHEDPTTA